MERNSNNSSKFRILRGMHSISFDHFIGIRNFVTDPIFFYGNLWLQVNNSVLLLRFVERLAESIASKLEVSNKLQTGRVELQRKKEEVENSIKSSANNMEKLKKRVLVLKGNIEQSISKLFNNRPVTIIGDLNKF